MNIYIYIYILDRIKCPLFFQNLLLRGGENVPYHEEIVSLKYKRNWFIFEGTAKPLKNAIFLRNQNL